MNWQLAVEKHHEALKRILASLVAMVAISGERSATLPRHLHRLILRLLRPAESAARRLIIVAARGLVVKVTKPSPRKTPEMQSILVNNGGLIGVAQVPVQPQRLANPKRVPSFSLLDPMKRFSVQRRSSKRIAMPSSRLLGGDDPIVPLFRRPEPEPPPPPSQDDPLDTRCIHRRLEALGRALEDLPGQARRFARRQARIEAASVARTDEKPRAEQSQPRSDTQGKRRFRRAYPMRPGRPPGSRRRPDHEVYEVLRDLHGLAVWARERPDTS